MSKIGSIKKTLVIGSGPIVIGQAAEFDYSGTQACLALRNEGVEVVLINSNPATIMTDKEIAHKIYIEPICIDSIVKIIEKERPDSLLASMGGQTALNMAVELNDRGILDKYGIKILGTSIESIKKGEDRDTFRETMYEIGEPIVESEIVNTIEEGITLAEKIGYPVVVRPAYTLGGTGGGFANDRYELVEILSHGLSLSPVNQVLIEKSIKGWMEIEYEVIRDKNSNVVIVCNMENIDPVGVHTGDSIVVAPCQSLDDKVLDILKQSSINIVNSVGVCGSCNVQLALNPHTYEYNIIEINPRLSRSSALASKATGYPIAKVATKIALGYTLDEILSPSNNQPLSEYEPNPDYVVVKIPKWPFDKFKFANRSLGTKMMATGEIMSIGDNFYEAFLKGIRSLETNHFSLENAYSSSLSDEKLEAKIQQADDERIFHLAEYLRRGHTIEEIEALSGILPYYLEKIKWIVDNEEALKNSNIHELTKERLTVLKERGFADHTIAQLLNTTEDEIRSLRESYDILPKYKIVDIAHFKSKPSFYYGSYCGEDQFKVENRDKIIVLGSGPIRIGQGIEFDYSCVHCAKALKELDIESIIINNNPETVSTDFDTSDKLYFEPLTEEDVLNIIEREHPHGVIFQFGGQTSIKLAKTLNERGIKILGTSFENIDRAEDREKFEELLNELNINRPKGRGVWTVEEGIETAKKLGYPLLVRPSYVLGGQGMEITYDEVSLKNYLKAAFMRDSKNPVLIDKYLTGIEIEIDAIFDGEDILIPGVMEHLEKAGVHSGDSISIYPSENISTEMKAKILDYTERIARSLNSIGMLNIQFIEHENELYIIEVNPRASRTIPYISKITGVPIIEIATRVILGEKLKDMAYGTGLYKEPDIVAVKVPVFSMSKLSGVEISVGPEMKSTGEVLGVGKNLSEALFKGFLASGISMDEDKKKILATINDKNKEEFLTIAKEIYSQGYEFFATEGTYKLLVDNGIEATLVAKVHEESPDILDVIKENKVDLVINTPTKGKDAKRDGFKIRRCASEYGVNIFTSLDTFKAITQLKNKHLSLKDLEIFEFSTLLNK